MFLFCVGVILAFVLQCPTSSTHGNQDWLILCVFVFRCRENKTSKKEEREEAVCDFII